MNVEKTATVKLSEFFLGDQRIRYLLLTKSENVFVSCASNLFLETQSQTECVPLFLASDVLVGIHQMSKNHPRIHTRFSKHGLATKLKLLDHRIADITNGHEVWFYSVQGLYQAVFEYHSRPIMKECLITLRDLWLKRFDDGPLPVDIEVKKVICEDEAVNWEEDISTSIPSETCSSFRLYQAPEEPPYLSVNPTIDASLSSFRGSGLGEKPHVVSHSAVEEIRELDLQLQLENILQKVSVLLDQHNRTLQSRERLDALKHTLHFCLADLFRENYSRQTSFPVCLLKAYTNILYGDSVYKTTDFENHFGVDVQWNLVLCIFSEFLGKEFGKFEDKISERVDNFKKSHIGQIDSLPTPQSLVDHLFPSCMSCLLENWMGVHRTRYIPSDSDITGSTNQSELSDHNYIHQPGTDLSSTSEPGHDLTLQHYPFIQLILEFTNNCLISGVAHVLYSRLRDGMI